MLTKKRARIVAALVAAIMVFTLAPATTAYGAATPVYHTVTFVDWDGTVLDIHQVEDGAYASLIMVNVNHSDLSRPGYTFNSDVDLHNNEPSNWTLISPDNSLGDKVHEDRVYTVHYIPLRYVVPLNPNGGTLPDGELLSKGAVFDYQLGELCVPSRTGYTFLGWYDKKSGGTQFTADTVWVWTGGTLRSGRQVVDSDITLYAHWKAKTYTLTLNANKGKVSKKSKVALKVTFGKKVGKLPTPKRNGYIFKGWYTKRSGGSKITSAYKYAKTKNLTLYARWN
jgi:uncharacterized repeat protein (TIGR02543 family)